MSDNLEMHPDRKGENTEKKLGEDQSRQAWVTDPAGVRIEFHQYTAKSCQSTGATCVLA